MIVSASNGIYKLFIKMVDHIQDKAVGTSSVV